MIITIYGSKKKTRKQREKERSAWKEQQEKYTLSSPKRGVSWTPEVKKSLADTLNLHRDRLTRDLPSRDSGIGVAVKKEANTYTGDKLIGIGSLHKSNLVPVFKEDEAKDLASMRR